MKPASRFPLRRILIIVASLALVSPGTFAAFTATSGNSGNSFASASDFVAPSVSATTIERNGGGGAGYLKQGATYYVYANVSDSGNPASGVATVTANVSTVTAAQTAASLTTTGGPWTVGGTSYSYRSSLLTADNPLSEGSKSYSITSTDNASNSQTQSGYSVTIDNTASSVSASKIAKTPGYWAGSIKQGGNYYIYANVSDSSSGVSTVTADVSTVTAGQTAVTLTAGSYTAQGTSYGYRSAQLTADNPLSNGSKSYTITSTDNVGNSQTQSGYTVSVTTTTPTGHDFQITNGTGNTSGKLEQNDTVKLTSNNGIDSESVKAGWDGTSVNTVVRLNDGGAGNDTLSFYDSTNTTQLNTGTIDLGGTGYTTSNITFGASGTASTLTEGGFGNQLTFVLGTASASASTVSSDTTGSWTLSASMYDLSGNAYSTGPVSSTVDNTAPSVSSTKIAKTFGYLAGNIKQGGSYFVYANISDASTIQSVTADASTVTAGQTAVALASGSYSAQGTSYNYRNSVSLTADNPLAAGSKSYTITTTDSVGNTKTYTGYTVTVNNTQPQGSDIQCTNDSGGTVGLAELNDKCVFTYTGAVDPESILSGWDGTSTSVVVRIDNNVACSGSPANDRLTIFNSTNTSQLNFGCVDLGRTDYTTANVTFGASGTASTMVSGGFGTTITVTLGTLSGSVTTAAATGTAIGWPSGAAYDAAGNTLSTAIATEQGAADKEF